MTNRLFATIALAAILVASTPVGTALLPPLLGFPGDPLHVTPSKPLAHPGDTVEFAISASNTDGSGRTASAASLRVDVYGPTHGLVVSGAVPTEVTAPATGAYRLTFNVGTTPILGSYQVVVRSTDSQPASATTAFSVEATPIVPVTQAQVQSIVNAQETQTEAAINAALALLRAHFDERLDDLIVGNVTLHENLTLQVETKALVLEVLANQSRMQLESGEHYRSTEEHRELSPEYTATEAKDANLAFIASLWWLVWIVYVLLTRLIRVHWFGPVAKWIRIAADLASFGLLALPIPPDQRGLLFALQFVVLVADCYLLLFRER